MRFGSATDEATSVALLDRYVEAGGTFLDTANIYARWEPGCRGGESEALLGRWMRQRRNRRRLVLASKVGFEYPGVERGLRARQIEEECQKSLGRLGVETMDLYYAHVDDRATPLEETLEAFNRLVAAGKVRFIGASNFAAWRLAEARSVSRAAGWAAYACIQQRYTYLRPKPGATFGAQVAANADLLDYCKASGTTLLAYSPLLRGAYTRTGRALPTQYVGPDSDARIAALKAVAGAHGATPNQVVLAWMLASDPPVIPVFAASTMDQINEDLGALDLALTAEEMDRLNKASA
jgi:aryl-alcohol dehydrogenase-like predicted oxidoreductase